MAQTQKNKFFKEMWPLLARHIGGILVSGIFWVGLSGFMTGKLVNNLICSVVFLIAYSIPSYTYMWGLGHSDRNFENFGHGKRDNLKGLKLGLVVLIPNIVLGILFILSKFSLFYNITVAFKIANVEVMPLMNLIESSLYMPDISYLELIGMFMITLMPAVLCEIYYLLGKCDFKPMQKLMYKKPENNSTDI